MVTTKGEITTARRLLNLSSSAVGLHCLSVLQGWTVAGGGGGSEMAGMD